MTAFLTIRVPDEPDGFAPDRSEVRLLLDLGAGGMAHFSLPPGAFSTAVTHRTIEEIWYFLAGRGRVWRQQGEREEIVEVEPGVCLTVPLGTHFQFHNDGDAPLEFIIATMPPWPGDDEAVPVPGYWPASGEERP
jgi:mannose-6-phosphate isomerase-like protein (cupin superfamily)